MMGIGVLELIIIGLIVLVPLILLLLVLVFVMAGSRKQNGPASRPGIAPCPKCQQLVAVQAKFCPECGQPLK